ncbi:MAG: glycoside hydrolase family 2 protein [Clostridia bacterium]|nr:glycoside hydrolase family 2 protein [Clostridia bacterium]
MRKIINVNSDWSFLKGVGYPYTDLDSAEKINLPHTWNAIDGQDGGDDYFRGDCVYVKKFAKADLPVADDYYIEICGANSSSVVYLNGEELVRHDGGYSTFRAKLTDGLKEDNEIAIVVNNAPNDHVYPQFADFTFYGGLYRNVNIIAVNATRFDLDYYGGPGIMVTPTLGETDAEVEIETFITNIGESDEIEFTILDKEGNAVANATTNDTKISLKIANVHRWHGRKDPYLYTATATIKRNGEELDSVKTRFGCRTFKVDPENGFILNGEEYPLRGVSRHQDRLGIGNALLPEHHAEDIEYIYEVGATTIRLAHYQHDQYFYDLCDEKGFVVWAEIPYISHHLPGGRANTISQMKELIVQNYNHASICVWGLSNEITMNGAKDPDLLENHHILNDMVHEMDKTRLTTLAVVSMCSMDEEYVHISDLVSYNHYFGWYGGTTDMNGPWFDKFHEKYPNRPVGVSEYGCEALNWHTSNPVQGDYTEEYQAFYHEELIKQLFSRKYIWATHVWNMFDFGADLRSEGGENGQNHKGLMTFDRKYKKDAFYAYKAWLSNEPFVHLCGKRYIDRVEEVTKVTVYSNLPEVELFANGVSLGKKTAEDHFFYFEVKNEGETTLKAVAGEFIDEGIIRKVDKMNEDYVLKEKGAVLNWFDIDAPEGRFSLNDTFGDILNSFRGKLWALGLALTVKKKMKQKQKDSGETEAKSMTDGMNFKELMPMLSGFTVLRMTNMIGMVGISFTKEELLKMNKKLNRIKKPKNKKK